MTTLAQWSSGTLPTLVGGSGITSDSSAGLRPPAMKFMQAPNTNTYAQFDFAAVTTAAHRFYVKTPAAWPSASFSLFVASDGTAGNVKVNMTGTSAPGSLRLLNKANATVVTSPATLLVLDTWYRVEVLIDHAAGTTRVLAAKDDSTVYDWDSGVVSSDFGTQHTRVALGASTTSTTVGTFYLDDIVLTDGTAAVGSASPYTPAPVVRIAQWLNGPGQLYTNSTGNVSVAGPYIKILPAADGKAYAEWVNPVPADNGLAVRFYYRYVGAAWPAATVNLLTVLAPGGPLCFRVDAAGSTAGFPGQVKIIGADGATVMGSSSGRYLPLGVWRRVEVKWANDTVTVTVYNRFEEAAFTVTAPVPVTTHKILSFGHRLTTPTPPELDINGLTWSVDPGENPLGSYPGIIPTPILDVSSVDVIKDGVLRKANSVAVMKNGVVKNASIGTVQTGPFIVDPKYVSGWGSPTWVEEFEGTAIDTTKWNIRDNTTVNYDQATIMARNCVVNNSVLSIIGKREQLQPGRPFTVGYIDTIGKFSAKFGRWEMLAWIPTVPGISRGIWPAFWLRGDNVIGEIDIMEAYGTPQDHPEWEKPGGYEVTIHENTSGVGAKENRAIAPLDGRPLSEGWHRYAVEWTPEKMVFLLDGVPCRTYLRSTDDPWFTTSMDGPFNIRLNMQIGNQWQGNPDPAHPEWTVLPVEYKIDWIRYWPYKGA